MVCVREQMIGEGIRVHMSLVTARKDLLSLSVTYPSQSLCHSLGTDRDG